MSRNTTMTVRLGEALSEHVSSKIGNNGTYDNVSEYVRDLIRKDKERSDMQVFERLKSELQSAFAAPDESYIALSADDIIKRNQSR